MSNWKALVAAASALVTFTAGMVVNDRLNEPVEASAMAEAAATSYDVLDSLAFPWTCGETRTLTTTWLGHWQGDDEYPVARSKGELPLDFSGAAGSPLLAPAAGTIRKGYNSGSGHFVRLDLGGGWSILLLHLPEPSPVEGHVERGTVIGAVGTTGMSTAPHIHVGIQLNGGPPDTGQITTLFGQSFSAFSKRGSSFTSNNCASTSAPAPTVPIGEVVQPAGPVPGAETFNPQRSLDPAGGSPSPTTTTTAAPTATTTAPPPPVTTTTTAPPPTTTTTTPPRPKTYPETTGGETHTWSNRHNAGGEAGPVIPRGTTVQVKCKATGFAVANGNNWWYLLASHATGYWASADAFYNNGQTSGSLQGTPYYDPAVPDC